ncbi:YceI family protein [Paludibacterium denitrificans]|uniref:YceI family protein n=1 Tax=Paludibacterium denitrificans TaxID=2675226 RepID=UPI001E4BDEA4|nr:YceI family protein [Paludibacterium denitrificans]
MKKLILLTALLATGLAQAAPINSAQSHIGFTMKQLNVPVDGSFKNVSGTVTLDLKKPIA